jgi:YtkA-like
MRGLLLYAVAGGIALVVLAVGIFLFFFNGDGSSRNANGQEECGPAKVSTQSAGSAEISPKAIGKSYARRMVIRVQDKESGAPLRDADVKVRGEMTCPHLMPLLERKLPEASSGTYRGDYNLIMPGHWTLYITVRSKEGDATTTALPIEVRSG